MNDIGKKELNSNSEKLHVAILKKILLSEVRIPTWMFTLFSLNIVISGWHLIDSAIERETLTFLRSFFEEFEMSFDFFQAAFHTSIQYIPIKPAIILLINIALLFSLVKFSNKVKKTLQ